ncbi:MAG: endolytic transglycosylase MltG, partial [Candidatus Zambryskibacteria bacterium]|nr:endolytic transglycosylase MltG [Candidatus Zambryskibacteria bacterium]
MKIIKKSRIQTSDRIKLRHTIILFIISLGIFLGMMFYYHLDWSLLSSLSFYESLANPSVKIVRIGEGLRKEEVANILVDKFGWNDSQKNDFLNAHLAYAKESLEGQYFPKTYLIHKDSDPVVVSKTMTDEYRKEVGSVKKPKSTNVINENTALIVASLIQREASGNGDMKLISGIIWNRIFKGMKLQIDATLQYAKGDEDLWWPQVKSGDKNIDSPFNTYMYAMPPTPIANPGLAALEAAYNPQKTSCLFYLHKKNKKIG